MRGGAVAAITAQRRQRQGNPPLRSSSTSSDSKSSSSLSNMTNMLGAVKKKATQTVSAAGTAARQGMGAAKDTVSAAGTAARQGMDAAKDKLDAAKDKLGISRTSQNGEDVPLHRHGHLEEVRGIQETDSEDVKELVGMGFSRSDSIWSLRQVGAGNVQEAALLLSSELMDAEVLTREADRETEMEGEMGNDTSAAFKAGTWVQCHGFQTEPASALNGQVGQIIRYNSTHRRYVVKIKDEHKMIRAANLKKATLTVVIANSVHAEMPTVVKSVNASSLVVEQKVKASLKGTMGSMQEMRRKAGALLSTSKSKHEEEEQVVPVDPEKREAALKAAEQRMAAAKARSGGTMEDWRRQQRELEESRLLELRKNQEQQGLLRPSSCKTSSEEVEGERLDDSCQEQPAIDLEPELLDVADDDLQMTAEEQEALMGEDFAMQQALALSLESGRDVLDQDRVEQACANADAAQGEILPPSTDQDNDPCLKEDEGDQQIESRDKSADHSKNASCVDEESSSQSPVEKGSIPHIEEATQEETPHVDTPVAPVCSESEDHDKIEAQDATSEHKQLKAEGELPNSCPVEGAPASMDAPASREEELEAN